MNKAQVISSFIRVYQAAKDKQPLDVAVTTFISSLPKRKRRWFKKPKTTKIGFDQTNQTNK